MFQYSLLKSFNCRLCYVAIMIIPVYYILYFLYCQNGTNDKWGFYSSKTLFKSSELLYFTLIILNTESYVSL